MLSAERLQDILSALPKIRIAVVGDLFLDRYWMIDPRLDEPSLETGLTAWQVVEERLSPGAAGTVLNNLSALGIGRLHCVSLLGDDGEGAQLKRQLTRQGVRMEHTRTSEHISSPSYTKPMFLQPDGTWQEGNRVDRKNLSPTPQHLQEAVIRAMRALSGEVDAIILLDQLTQEDCGVITAALREAAAAIAAERPELCIFADSRAHLDRFIGVSVKCNDKEARLIAGLHQTDDFDRDSLEQALHFLQERTERPVFVTCSRHGIAVLEEGRVRLLPAVRHTGPIDVVGAGDASTAGLVSALCAGASPAEAAAFANLCAGVTLRKIGTTGTAGPGEILALFREETGDAV